MRSGPESKRLSVVAEEGPVPVAPALGIASVEGEKVQEPEPPTPYGTLARRLEVCFLVFDVRGSCCVATNVPFPRHHRDAGRTWHVPASYLIPGPVLGGRYSMKQLWD